jgi:phage terminase large subunit
MASDLVVDLPNKLLGLFEPKRYFVAHGGRGGGKSQSFATALLVKALAKPIRVLCTREVQKSIKESVKRLLDDQIQAMNLGPFFDSTETEIRGKNDSLFIFAGLANHTVESVKSYANIDVCWIEEGQSISKRSLDILIPTIRAPESEIWISFNPELDTDPVWERFVVNPPPDCITVQINYNDNPWFPAVLEKERIHCFNTNKADYDWIWEGKCKAAVDGAIYFNEITQAITDNRITHVPYNPELKVHTVWDLGWNDSMTIIMCQRHGSALYVIDYIEDSHKTLDQYVQMLKERRYNWGTDYIPHDGRHKDFKYGKSAEEMLQSFGRTVSITPNTSIEDGIRLARQSFSRMYFDKNKCDRLVNCLKRYRRSINWQTLEPGAPLHNEYSHGADSFRYLAINIDSMTNEDWGGSLKYPSLSYA